MIKPTIGRVVWFFDPGLNTAEPQAAIVTRVHSDTCVNLAVFSHDGIPGPRTSVSLHQGEGDPPSWPHAQWMPFQIGQAKRLEGEPR